MAVELDQARVGDVVEITGHRVEEARRSGVILEILGEPSHPHFRVRWAEGKESIFYPSSDATLHPATGAESSNVAKPGSTSRGAAKPPSRGGHRERSS